LFTDFKQSYSAQEAFFGDILQYSIVAAIKVNYLTQSGSVKPKTNTGRVW